VRRTGTVLPFYGCRQIMTSTMFGSYIMTTTTTYESSTTPTSRVRSCGMTLMTLLVVWPTGPCRQMSIASSRTSLRTEEEMVCVAMIPSRKKGKRRWANYEASVSKSLQEQSRLATSTVRPAMPPQRAREENWDLGLHCWALLRSTRRHRLQHWRLPCRHH
jgi:hypothetical protein